MEGINTRPEDDDDSEDELVDNKKSKAEKTGSIKDEPESDKSQKAEAEKRHDLLSLLTGKTVKVETDSLDPEADDIEAQLTPIEEQQIEHDIVLERQANPETGPIDEAEFGPEATAAVEDFHSRIIDQELDPSTALAETLAEIDADDASGEILADSETSNDLPLELTEETVLLNPATHETVDEADQPPIAPTTLPDQSAAGTSPRRQPFFGPSLLSAEAPTPPINNYVYRHTPDTAATPHQTTETESTGSLIVGNIVSYLIGQRRGRIKSEKRLMPIQKKLETQVKILQTEIVAKEFTIRQAVAEKVRAEKVNPIEKPNRAKAPEANRLHSPVPPERIGRVIITAEAPKPAKIEKATLLPIDRHVETLSRADLLELSSKISIEGTNLRNAFENHLIGEKGLRRIVIEHLRGGDIRKALKREILEHEIDFERDPMMRDKAQQSSSNTTALNDLLQKANATAEAENKSDDMVLDARIKYAEKQKQRQQQRRSTIDVAMISTIAVLLFLVIMLVINRH